jgi:peptidoglycan/xylan/chitin deacetylase (PgdA/CDA1 family)
MILKDYSINIIMYHYVRPIKHSQYPKLKGLELKEFCNQIKFLKRKSNILSHNEIFEILKSKKIPRKPSVFLTFDDGYKDHYKYVFPYLQKNKISGSFYTPVKTVQNKITLDVNKIHFILEKENNKNKIYKEIKYIVKKKFKRNINDFHLSDINLNSKYDNKITTLIKKLLQTHLPIQIRKYIINTLFKKILNISYSDFNKQLYLNIADINEMIKYKMTFGVHGNDHLRWGELSKEKQKIELNKSLEFLKKIDKKNKKFSVCYPYGSYNKETFEILNRNDISFALTTKKGVIKKDNFNLLELPRIDTNEL